MTSLRGAAAGLLAFCSVLFPAVLLYDTLGSSATSLAIDRTRSIYLSPVFLSPQVWLKVKGI